MRLNHDILLRTAVRPLPAFDRPRQGLEASALKVICRSLTTTDWPVASASIGCHVPRKVPAETAESRASDEARCARVDLSVGVDEDDARVGDDEQRHVIRPANAVGIVSEADQLGE